MLERKYSYMIERVSDIFGESVYFAPGPVSCTERQTFCDDASHVIKNRTSVRGREKLGCSMKRSQHVVLSPVEAVAVLSRKPYGSSTPKVCWRRWSLPAIDNDCPDRNFDSVKIVGPSWDRD